jgi:hypothetical protein
MPDTGPGYRDLGGLNGDVHLVGEQGTLDILQDGSFVPVTDARAELTSSGGATGTGGTTGTGPSHPPLPGR